MDPMGLVVTKNVYFSLLTHAKQLLFVTFCKTTAGNGASFWTHGRRTEDGRTDGRTERRGSRNSYLDDTTLCITTAAGVVSNPKYHYAPCIAAAAFSLTIVCNAIDP